MINAVTTTENPIEIHFFTDVLLPSIAAISYWSIGDTEGPVYVRSGSN
jgi:hypothetical protein